MTSVAGSQEQPPPPVENPNPCLKRELRLRCPDLLMRAPHDLRIDRRTRPGRVLLRSSNSIDNRGTGPAELRGRRSSSKMMIARQRIHRRSGRLYTVSTHARLVFKAIPGQYRYWKFAKAARFELWSLDRRGKQRKRVRVGPKLSYCLRDLSRTRPSGRSPSRRVYPGCSQNPGERAVTLGTSVGWSDIYPQSYHENWVDVTGLRGRFAFIQIADPENGIWESNELNNAGRLTIRLPVRSGRTRSGGESYGNPY